MNASYIFSLFTTKGCYLYFVSFQLLILVGLLIYEIVAFIHNDKNMYGRKSVIYIEVGITVLVFLEVIVKMIFMRRKFFKSRWNTFDFFNILVISILYAIDIYFTESFDEQHDSHIFPVILLWIRFLIQIGRSLAAMRASKEIMQASELGFDLSIDYEDQEYKKERRRSLVYNRKSKKTEHKSPELTNVLLSV